MNIILLGAPGAGKDTLADQLVEKFPNYQVLTPGAIYRNEASKGTELGVWARDTFWGKGMLCPDDVTNKIVHSAFGEANSNENSVIIFNGYPRTQEQVAYMRETMGIDLVLCLDVSEDVAAQRLLSRGRVDDTEEVIRERFTVFNKHADSIKDYCSDNTIPVITINADVSISRVFDIALKNISRFMCVRR